MWRVGERKFIRDTEADDRILAGPQPHGAWSWWVCHCLSIHCCGEVQWKDGHILVYSSKSCLFKGLNSLQRQLEVQPIAHMCMHVLMWGQCASLLSYLSAVTLKELPPLILFPHCKRKRHTHL